MGRPGWAIDWGALPGAYRALDKRVYPAPLIDISATQLRGRVGRGQSIEFLTPPAVAQFIARRKLYMDGRG